MYKWESILYGKNTLFMVYHTHTIFFVKLIVDTDKSHCFKGFNHRILG